MASLLRLAGGASRDGRRDRDLVGAQHCRGDRMWEAWEDNEWHGVSATRRFDDDDDGVENIAGAGNEDSAARGASPRSDGPEPTMPAPQEHEPSESYGNDGPRQQLTYSQLIATVLLAVLPLIMICIFTIGRGDGDPTLDPENFRNIPLPTGDDAGVNVEAAQPTNIANVQQSESSPAQRTLDLIAAEGDYIDNELFIYESPSRDWLPSTIYNHNGLKKGLEVMNIQGVAGMFYYLGEEGEGEAGHQYGLTNVAAFLAQSMKETIKYNACSENSWDNFGGYPLSNSCGQLGQSYQDYHCPKGEEHMECPVDKNMEITATTNAKWYGAPAPLFCRPKKNSDDFTGKWNHGYMCNVGWVDPPKVCDVYEGQSAGGFDNSKPVPNRNGRTDTEGCCWWGRGVIQTTGICNFGKLNYYLGAAEEGRETPYADVDFCKDPEIICSSTKYTELKWIAGMFYWMESVQKYDVRGWNYMEELHQFVDGGFQNWSFIDGVSGIVNRGCHDPPCGTGAVDGGAERRNNFKKALGAFKLIEQSKELAGGSQSGSLVLACGADFESASENCTICAHSQDCPDGHFCWNSVRC